jgi:hypothetical protein
MPVSLKVMKRLDSKYFGQSFLKASSISVVKRIRTELEVTRAGHILLTRSRGAPPVERDMAANFEKAMPVNSKVEGN